jgi:hypothetical protein
MQWNRLNSNSSYNLQWTNSKIEQKYENFPAGVNDIFDIVLELRLALLSFEYTRT